MNRIFKSIIAILLVLCLSAGLVACSSKPSEKTFTEAAEIAAYNSKSRGGQNIAVDYTRIKNVKKPGGAKPGFVIYNTNFTAYVTPDERRIEEMRKK